MDRVWVSGVNSWFLAKDYFHDFYGTDAGKCAAQLWQRRASCYSRREFPGTVVDGCAQLSLALPLCAFGLQLGWMPVLPLVLVPLLYWCVVIALGGGRSLGMRLYDYDYQNSKTGMSARGMDQLVRGMGGFALFLFFALDLYWLRRHKALMSSQALGMQPVFSDSWEVGVPAPVGQRDEELARGSAPRTGSPRQ
jgi:hypothetical protein